MRTQLHIGEAATLLGVSTKTIRHYQRLGLLAEPERTRTGYRLFAARDLTRLLRIRRLQALGLPLAQIKQVLGESDPAESLRRVLESLLETCSAQIRALEARRERIRAALMESAVDALDRPPETPTMLRWAEALVGSDLTRMSPAVWEQDVKLFGMLESFNWPTGYQEQLRRAAERYLGQPEQYLALLQVAERLAALATAPEDSPEVQRLAVDVAHSEAARMLLGGEWEPRGDPSDAYRDIMAEVLASALSPAQRRCLRLVREQSPETEDGG
jgi:DNA-binding transcriptional MerR regulator